MLHVLFVRSMTRMIGKRIRYAYLRLIGKAVTMKQLSAQVTDEYKDLGTALRQDFWNALIGTVFFIIISTVIALIVFD